MNILDIFVAFTKGIADIDHFRSSVQSAADREYRHLVELLEQLGDNHYLSMENMFFREAATGDFIFYGFRDLTFDEAIQSLVRHTNRQHQWFLAEAYELFEEFVKRAYAFMGMNVPKRWPLHDFGSIQWDEVATKDFDWFLDRARAKKDAPLSMLRQFGRVLPSLRIVETCNRTNCDLLTAVTMVGHLRHRIVHARGLIPDKERFAQDVVRKLGHSGSGMDAHVAFIQNTLLIDPRDNAIFLLRLPSDDSRPPLRIYHDIYEGMVRYLLIYAHAVYLALGGAAMTHFDRRPSVPGEDVEPAPDLASLDAQPQLDPPPDSSVKS